MSRLGTFETGLSEYDTCLWMLHDPKSYTSIAILEWQAELKNREDLVKNGFKIKKLQVPYWIERKCGKKPFEKFEQM